MVKKIETEIDLLKAEAEVRAQQRRHEEAVWKEKLDRAKTEFPLDSFEFEGNKLQLAKKRICLWAFCIQGLISDATRSVGISRQLWYDWCEVDPEFKRAAKEAEEYAVEALERMAIRRSEISDHLLMFLLKGGKPGKFKDRSEITGKNGAPLVSDIVQTVVILPSNDRGDEG